MPKAPQTEPTSPPKHVAHRIILGVALLAVWCPHGPIPSQNPTSRLVASRVDGTSPYQTLCVSFTTPSPLLGTTRRDHGAQEVEGTPWQQRWQGSGPSHAHPARPRVVSSISGWDQLPTFIIIFFSLPWKSKSGSWVGREPAKMNSNEPISIEIGSLPCQRLIKPNALNSLQQTRCWRQCPPSCLQEITHHFKIKRMKIQVGVYSCVRTSIPLQGCF